MHLQHCSPGPFAQCPLFQNVFSFCDFHLLDTVLPEMPIGGLEYLIGNCPPAIWELCHNSFLEQVATLLPWLVRFPVSRLAFYMAYGLGEPHCFSLEVTKLVTISVATQSLLCNCQLDVQVSVIQLRG